MTIKMTCLMVAVLGIIQPLDAKSSCFRPGRIAEFMRNNQDKFQDDKATYQMHGRNYEISPKVTLSKDQKIVLQPGKMDDSKTICEYLYETDGKQGVIKVTRLEKIYKLGNRCFNPERIVKSLKSGKNIVHYKGRAYTIDQSKVAEEKQIKMNQNPILITLKNGERSEGGMEDGKPVTVCTYRVSEQQQTQVIGEIIVKRTYKTCFHPDKILRALHDGSSVFTHSKREYMINQDALLTDKITKGSVTKLRLAEGSRAETIEDGKVKVVCTYRTFKADDQKREKEIGSVLVTRIKPSTTVTTAKPEDLKIMAPMMETNTNIGSN